jgi:peptidoglycan hydrolase CwlO-like protein
VLRRCDTTRLTRDQLELAPPRPLRGVLRILLVVVLAALMVPASIWLSDQLRNTESHLHQLEEANAQLRANDEKLRLEIEMNSATRAELERQLAALQTKLKQMEEELAFFHNSGASKASGRPAAKR